MYETLKTHRLTLKPYHLADPVAVADGLNDFEVSKWMSSVPFPYSAQDAAQFLASVDRPLSYAIYDDVGLVGAIGAGGELGYWLRKSAWGKGYATEATDVVVDAVFQYTDASRLYACFADENGRSGKVLTKAGFEPGAHIMMKCVAQNAELPGAAMWLSRDRWHARRQFRITTADLVLRDLRADDWRDMQRIAGHEDVVPMLSSVTLPWPDDAAKRWTRYGAFNGRLGFFAAICLPSGQVIGGVIFDKMVGDDLLTCGYFIDPAFWGRGYATQAMHAFLSRFMSDFDLAEVEADHFDDNPASGAVLRKLGFHNIGKDIGTSRARVEAAPITLYRLRRDDLRALT